MRRSFIVWLTAGASFQLFLGGAKFFFIFNATGLLKNWKKQHFICSNLTSFIVPFFLFLFFSFFSLFSFFFLFFFFSFSLGATAPQPPKWRLWLTARRGNQFIRITYVRVEKVLCTHHITHKYLLYITSHHITMIRHITIHNITSHHSTLH